MHAYKKYLVFVLFVFGCAVNDSDDKLRQANNFYESGSVNDAIELYRSLAENGNVVAIERLGTIYMDIQTKNDELAEKYLVDAANAGSANAMVNLSMGYKKIFGKSDAKKAIYWAERAADSGKGFYNLANFYYAGIGVPRNYEKALYYYERSVSINESDSLNSYEVLATMYAFGLGVAVNCEKSVLSMRKAIELQTKYGVTSYAYSFNQITKISRCQEQYNKSFNGTALRAAR